jgi:hypothetical protein
MRYGVSFTVSSRFEAVLKLFGSGFPLWVSSRSPTNLLGQPVNPYGPMEKHGVCGWNCPTVTPFWKILAIVESQGA